MIDTLRYSESLESVGVSREQAKAYVHMISEIVEENLATKQDLKELEYRLITKITAIVLAVAALSVSIIAVLIRFSH